MLNKTWIVYNLINNVTGERYIGMTSQSLKKRFKNRKMYINSIVAGKELNIPARSIRRVCSGERRHTHGYMFVSVEINEVINNE